MFSSIACCLAVAGKTRGQRKYLPEIWFSRTSLNPLWPYWSILYNLDSGLDCEEVEWNYCTGLFRHLLLLPMIEQWSDSSGFGSMVNGNKEEEGTKIESAPTPSYWFYCYSLRRCMAAYRIQCSSQRPVLFSIWDLPCSVSHLQRLSPCQGSDPALR